MTRAYKPARLYLSNQSNQSWRHIIIPNNLSVATVDNRLDGRKIEMKIDTDATVHLMSLLTALYSDQELACIREYSTNADDAHKDAGQTRPIEVTTPTSFYPYLRIKDYGIGMDAGTIEDVYSQYGRSTKREQTNTNGSMGIGGKSALAYTNQFSVIGIKDSIKTHVSVSIGVDGAGIMEIVDESLTDEGNGVEIVIPTKRHNEFGEKARAFFQFWPKGTVLLNGADPSKGLTKVSEHIYTVDDSHYYNKDVIVMGNVAYPVENGLASGDSIHKYGRKVQLAAFVTMNTPDEVIFTPSREGLIYTTQTNRVVAELRTEYRAAVVKRIQDTMTNAKSFGEAYKAYLELERAFAPALLAGINYKGQSMPMGYVKGVGTDSNARRRATVWSINQHRYAVSTGSELSYAGLMNTLIITNYPSTKGVSGTHKAKIKSYIRDNSITNRTVTLLPDGVVPGLPWTADATVVDWSVIRTIKLTPATASGYASKSYAGGYDVFDTAVGYYVLNHDLKKTDEIVYYSKARDKDQNKDSEYLDATDRDLILHYLPNAKIVECSKNRHEKLLRLFPKAITPLEAKEKASKIVIDSLTPVELEQIRIQSVYHLDYLNGIDYNSIDDPDLKRAVEVYRMKDTAGTRAFKQISADARASALKKIGAPAFTNVQSRYPLLTWEISKRVDHLIYINAKYATLSKGIKNGSN